MYEPYFLEYRRDGRLELYETDGTFYNHDSQDLLIATLYDDEEAERLCRILNDIYYGKIQLK
ncbi:hypothetical protein CIL05_07285 [Virgibacillus profundi]|uniref:Uncharacterized protein n=1 Tax=Virgibacillus profundi TaxID=2024555 RepID=A0A2A2IG93_9BACI|nr:hypothetical protein [Virgibacillus profundi]PAV30264.1 hypothetical protein CIL05_07285 [Virgibacillus profundi]PXY54436.1 hypothetical protein CIT14_07370 [Virgibacillus profundi]